MVEHNNNHKSADDGAQKVQLVNGQPLPNWQKVTPIHWFKTLQSLMEQPVVGEQRFYWMNVLRDWFEHHCQTQNQDQDEVDWGVITTCLRAMNEVAYQLCDWSFIVMSHDWLSDFGESDLMDGEFDCGEFLQVAVAYWQLGQLTMADTFLQRKLQLHSDEDPLRDFHHHIRQDLAAMPFDYSDRSAGELTLVPMDEQHLSGFCWVYQDPAIARLCGLPTFESDQQWFDWLCGDQANPAKQVFAVIHHHWNMIGSVSIEVHQGVGFFYYWFGTDFQGKGYGAQAVELLMRLAKEQLGLKCCYAKAFDENIRLTQGHGKGGL